MWKLHRADATKNSVRALSGRFGIPMERTLAVLRLMALEDEYRKEVSTPARSRRTAETEDEPKNIFD
jgi:hypothetical protein